MFSIIRTALMYILCKVGLGGDLHFLTLDDINSAFCLRSTSDVPGGSSQGVGKQIEVGI